MSNSEASWFGYVQRADKPTFAVQVAFSPDSRDSWFRGLDTSEQAESFAKHERDLGRKARVWRETVIREIMEDAQ